MSNRNEFSRMMKNNKVDFTKATSKITEEQLREYIKAISNTAGISIGAKIYNLFVMMKLTYDGGVENWKKFEREVAKMIFAEVDIDTTDMPDEFLTFQNIVDVFYSSAVMAGAMSRIAANPENAEEIIAEMGKIIPSLCKPEKTESQKEPETETVD